MEFWLAHSIRLNEILFVCFWPFSLHPYFLIANDLKIDYQSFLSVDINRFSFFSLKIQHLDRFWLDWTSRWLGWAAQITAPKWQIQIKTQKWQTKRRKNRQLSVLHDDVLRVYHILITICQLQSRVFHTWHLNNWFTKAFLYLLT